MDAPAGLTGTERQQADNPHAGRAFLRQRAQEQIRVVARADHQNAVRIAIRFVRAASAGAKLPPPIGHAWRAKQHNERKGMHQRQGRVGRQDASGPHQQGEQQGRENAGADHTDQIAKAGKTPVLQRQAERQPREQHGPGTAGHQPEWVKPDIGRIGDPARHRHGDSGQRAIQHDVNGDPYQGAGSGHCDCGHSPVGRMRHTHRYHKVGAVPG